MASEAHRETGDIAKDDEITIERRIRPRDADSEPFSSRRTLRIVRVDSQLLALARGEGEPGEGANLLVLDDPFGDPFADPLGDPLSDPPLDPFGGLIPVYEDDAAVEILDDWLVEDAEQELIAVTRPPPIPYSAVPRLCMAGAELVTLAIDHRSGFLLSHIDGQRSVDELIDISHLDRDNALEVIATLLALRAISVD